MADGSVDWRNAYLAWVAARMQLAGVRDRMAQARAQPFGAERAADLTAVHNTFKTLASTHLTELQEIMRGMRRATGDPRVSEGLGDLERIAVGVVPTDRGFGWELMGVFADGAVLLLETSRIAYPTRDLARRAGQAAVPAPSKRGV